MAIATALVASSSHIIKPPFARSIGNMRGTLRSHAKKAKRESGRRFGGKAFRKARVLLITAAPMSNQSVSTPPADIHSEEFLHELMRRQLRLSISCGVTFAVVLLGLPLANYFVPELMARRIGG